MKKRGFIILLCSLFIISLVSCSNGKPEATQSISEVEGIQFKVPSNWKKSNEETLVNSLKNSVGRYGDLFKVFGVEFSLPKDGLGAVLNVQMPSELDESKKNDLMVSMRKSGVAAMSGAAEKTENLETQEINIDGKKAERTSLNLSKSGQEMYVEIVTSVSGDRVYLMIFLVQAKNETYLKTSVDNVLETIDFN